MRLLDANVFIEAKDRYYGFDLVPAFWTWLEDQAEDGEIASTDMIYDELKDGGDDLAAWVKNRREFDLPRSIEFAGRRHCRRTARHVGSIRELQAPRPR